MKRVRSAGMIIYHQHQGSKVFLLLQYPRGHWDFSRGHVEKGETDTAAARREIFEETGLKSLRIIPGFKAHNLWQFKDKYGKTIYREAVYFLAESPTRRIQISDEHCSYVWLPARALHQKITFDNTKKIFQEAVSYLKQDAGRKMERHSGTSAR